MSEKDRLNVLSIDWDYFIEATGEQRAALFPDGGNEHLPSEIIAYIWASRYSESKAITDIKVDKKSVERVRRILHNWCERGMIVDSHRHAYEFIEDYLHEEGGLYEGINLVNIDYHHDCYNVNNTEVDCGNWFGKIMQKYTESSVYTWVKRPDSDMGGCGRDRQRLENVFPQCNVTTSLDIVDEYDWDIIFICRSGVWSPPHLDSEFVKMSAPLFHNAERVRYEDSIQSSRYTKEFRNTMMATKKAFLEVQKKLEATKSEKHI